MNVPETVYSILTGVGVAGIWILCMMLGLVVPKSHLDDMKEQRDEYKAAVIAANQRADNERARADTAEETAKTALILLAGLQKAVPNVLEK